MKRMIPRERSFSPDSAHPNHLRSNIPGSTARCHFWERTWRAWPSCRSRRPRDAAVVHCAIQAVVVADNRDRGLAAGSALSSHGKPVRPCHRRPDHFPSPHRPPYTVCTLVASKSIVPFDIRISNGGIIRNHHLWFIFVWLCEARNSVVDEMRLKRRWRG